MTRPIVLISTLLATFVAAGCATTPPEETRLASATSHECKAVTVYSASEQIRHEVRGTPPADELARTEGRMDIGRAKLNAPLQLRNLPETNVLNAAVRDC